MTDEIKKMDLYEIFTKPVAEMSDEELTEAVGIIREQRKLKIVSQKAKSGLDILLGKLTAANARVILEQLKAKEAKEAAEAETKKQE